MHMPSQDSNVREWRNIVTSPLIASLNFWSSKLTTLVYTERKWASQTRRPTITSENDYAITKTGFTPFLSIQANVLAQFCSSFSKEMGVLSVLLPVSGWNIRFPFSFGNNNREILIGSLFFKLYLKNMNNFLKLSEWSVFNK